jgi:glycerophosphoryl diester phosphodiesterase
MAKSRRRITAYVHHKPSGQARVRINSKDHYLGLLGSPEEEVSCKRFICRGASVRFCIAITCLLFVVTSSSPCVGQFIVAHRGASYDAPENTLAAFRLAWEQGADAIEGDFYLTSDGQIVCIHDRTTKRVAPDRPELTVAKSTLEQLRHLDVGRWKDKKFAGERIPTLEEVLAVVPKGKRIFVEIKCGPEIVPALQKQLAASRLNDQQIVIIAFNESVVQACRRSMPKYHCNWLTSYRRKKGQTDFKPAKQDVITSLRRTSATGLGTQANEKVIDRSFVKSVRDAGCGFHVWTVNDPNVAKRFVELGVDSITTDRPALIRRVVPSSKKAANAAPIRHVKKRAVARGR